MTTLAALAIALTATLASAALITFIYASFVPNKQESADAFTACISCLVVILLLSLGAAAGISQTRANAVKAGAAHYEVFVNSAGESDTVFVWGPAKK